MPTWKERYEQKLTEFAQGNPEALFRYWETGKGGEMIGWGNPEEGDLTRCHDLVVKYLPEEDDAWGFCQNRKIAVSGKPNPRDEDDESA